MDEPLLSEDTDLERLLAGIRERHGDRARILYQDSVRRGGVLGFFATDVHRVAYRIQPADTRPDVEPAAEPATALDALIDEVDAVESILAEPELLESTFPEAVLSDAVASTPEASAAEVAGAAQAFVPVALDFARVLRAIESDPDAADAPIIAEQAAEAAGRSATVTQLAGRDARTRLDVLMTLREVGVPVGINPRGEAHSIYQAMEEILAELPEAPTAPREPGDVLALVGELVPALRAAQSIAHRLRISESDIVVAGLTGHPAAELFSEATEPVLRTVSSVREVIGIRTELRLQQTPSVVVIATDAAESDPDDPWAAEILHALQPKAAWLMVDATRKPEDNQAEVDRLGGIDAVAVYSTQLSASPATVWDLGLPVALLDGRPASTFTWAGLLFGALTPRARRHQATA